MRVLVAAVAVALVSASVASATSPPDGRGYELVSPADKLGGLPSFPTTASQAFASFQELYSASSDGNNLLWMSVEALLPDAKSSMQMSYESKRTASGWQTVQQSPDPVTPHPFALISKSIVIDATDDLSRTVISSREPFDPLIQGSFSGAFKINIFLQNTLQNADPNAVTWVSGPNSGASTADVNAIYLGRDAAADHILFSTPEELTPNAVGMVGSGLYDHTGGQTVLVDVDNLGDPVHPCGAMLGALTSAPSFDVGGNIRGAVSGDGSRIAFTVPDPTSTSGDPSCSDLAKVYVRKNGVTTEASRDRRTVADPMAAKPAVFQGGSITGPDKIFFTSERGLTDSAANGTSGRPLLYEYDVDTDTLTLITPNTVTPPFVSGVVGISDDGSHVYFIARGQLTPDAPASTGVRKLYEYDNGQITYVGAISTGELGRLIGPDTARNVRFSPDGNEFVFQTSDSLGGYNTAGTEQIYLYDAPTATLTCVSCPADGSDPAGEAWLQRDTGNPERQTLSRNVTDDGRVFFDTPTSLVPQDDNGVADVYEWNAGALTLISGGHGSEGSYLMDTANDGQDVFFVTTDRLVQQDTDPDLDIYDARVGGGFAAPATAPGECSGDACQGQPAARPTLPEALSATVFGDGNATADSGRKATLSVQAISAKARRAFARTGRVTLVAHVGSDGVARVTARARIGGRTRVVGRVRETVDSAGAVRMQLRLSATARRWLERHGRLRVTITVTFPAAASRTATLTLIKPTNAGR